MLLYHLVTVHSSGMRPIYALAAAGLRLGAPRGLSVGRVAGAGHLRRREDRVQHFVFRHLSLTSPGRSRAFPNDAGRRRPDESHDVSPSGTNLHHAGPVDGTGSSRRLFIRSVASAPLARPDLRRTADSICKLKRGAERNAGKIHTRFRRPPLSTETPTPQSPDSIPAAGAVPTFPLRST